LSAARSGAVLSSADRLGAELARTLAALADLPLAEGRDAIVGELLAAWLPPANELSGKMSAAEHSSLLPATVFTHAAVDDEA
jgi:hypothetical protein